MRESCLLGSVRGVSGNRHSYRDIGNLHLPAAKKSLTCRSPRDSVFLRISRRTTFAFRLDKISARRLIKGAGILAQ